MAELTFFDGTMNCGKSTLALLIHHNVAARCWCGERGSQNARTVDGVIQRMGEQVVVGDLGAGEVSYEVLCRRHFREGITRGQADHEALTAGTEPRRTHVHRMIVPSGADLD